MERDRRGHRGAVDIWLIVAGVLFLIWPLQYRRSVRRIHERVATRGGDIGRFDRSMSRPWIRAMLIISPLAGIGLIVLGVLG